MKWLIDFYWAQDSKANLPNFVCDLKHTLVCEWFVIGCESKNEHQRNTCSNEIGLHVNHSKCIVNIHWGTYMIIEQLKESSLWQWIGWSYKLQKLRGRHIPMGMNWICQPSRTNYMFCIIPYKGSMCKEGSATKNPLILNVGGSKWLIV